MKHLKEKCLKTGMLIGERVTMFWENLKKKTGELVASIKVQGGNMIGGLEKGMEAARVASPPKSVVNGVELSKVASYVGFKAAMSKNKMTMEMILLLQFVFVVGLFGYSVHLNSKLRNRTLLMVPSQITGVTEVVPNSLPPSRIHKAFVHFASLLGNIHSSNVQEHYKMLRDYMSRDLQIKFAIESEPIIRNVLEEGLSEYIKLGEKTVEPNGKGEFRITAPLRVSPFANGMELKERNEFIVMRLRIVAPKDKNTWGLEIVDLKRMSGSTFNSKNRLGKNP